LAEKTLSRKSLVNVLGVVYVHTRTSDGGDMYLTRHAEQFHRHFDLSNWYEKSWFDEHKIRLRGTSSVYRVPTKEVGGRSLDLVVKNCRVGEDVPINTHTLQEFCDAEFNSPWEEFSLVTEMRDGRPGPGDMRVKTQRPMAIYVPPERMQLWQSGRSRAKINRIRSRHPGIDLDILKQYKLIYQWIEGKNLLEVFEHADVGQEELVRHLKAINAKVIGDLGGRGYIMADMKPEHIIISQEDTERIEEIGRSGDGDAPRRQMEMVHRLLKEERYSVVDYELLMRTPEHENEVKFCRRHSYLDDQLNRFVPTPLPAHLSSAEVFGVPYIFGHTESTGGRLWVVGKNARLFDYFLPERWRKTPSLRLSDSKEVFYTITKDNIHLVWKTSRVGETPGGDDEGAVAAFRRSGIPSPFEEFALANALSRLGIPTVYARAIYMTGSQKIEASSDLRKYQSHRGILDPEGNPILQENHNYITIRGYYNGPDHWVAEQKGPLYSPMDLSRALRLGIIDDSQCEGFMKKVKERLREAGYDGSLLEANDLLIALDAGKAIMKNVSGEPEVIICNFERIRKLDDDASP